MRVVRVRRPRLCLVVGHRYAVAPTLAIDEAPCWPCQRCGRKRYRQPPDFLDGAAGAATGPI
jgi:hypothetical protein